MRHPFLALIFFLTWSGAADAQARESQSKLLLYNHVTGQPSALDRAAKNAYAGKFRVIDIRLAEGFAPGHVKGHDLLFFYTDPRPEREEAVPAKVVLLWVVTPEGSVIEPRILHSTDARLADYVLNLVTLRRYAPARLRGSPVFSLWGDEFVFGSESKRSRDSDMFKNGLGIQGYRDR